MLLGPAMRAAAMRRGLKGVLHAPAASRREPRPRFPGAHGPHQQPVQFRSADVMSWVICATGAALVLRLSQPRGNTVLSGGWCRSSSARNAIPLPAEPLGQGSGPHQHSAGGRTARRRRGAADQARPAPRWRPMNGRSAVRAGGRDPTRRSIAFGRLALERPGSARRGAGDTRARLVRWTSVPTARGIEVLLFSLITFF
jgi:hypothetical protein